MLIDLDCAQYAAADRVVRIERCTESIFNYVLSHLREPVTTNARPLVAPTDDQVDAVRWTP